MTKDSDGFVVKHPDGWAVKLPGAKRASSVHKNQDQAIKAARRLIKNQGGGEMNVQRKKGQIRQKNTIDRKDPFPPEG